MRHFCIALVLLIASPLVAQNYEAAVKRRLNEQHNNAEDKALFNKKFGPAIKILSISKPIDLDSARSTASPVSRAIPACRSLGALMKADAEKAGLGEVRSDTVSIKDTSLTEWTPVGMAGKAIRVKC